MIEFVRIESVRVYPRCAGDVNEAPGLGIKIQLYVARVHHENVARRFTWISMKKILLVCAQKMIFRLSGWKQCFSGCKHRWKNGIPGVDRHALEGFVTCHRKLNF